MEAKFWVRPEVSVAYNGGYGARTLAELTALVQANRELIERTWMTSLAASPTAVRFDEYSMWVNLSDGRVLGVPLAWFPRLFHAAPEQREQVRLSARGLHWESLDEDVSVAGLLDGLGDQTHRGRTVAA